jgi:hypothetical protein
MALQLAISSENKIIAQSVFGEAPNWYTRFMYVAQQAGVDIVWTCRHTNQLEREDWLCMSVHYNGNTDRAIYFISLLMGDVCDRLASDTLQGMYLVDKDYTIDDYTVPFECNPIVKKGWALILPNVRTGFIENFAATLPTNARYEDIEVEI